MIIITGATSFELDRFVIGEKFTAGVINCTIKQIKHDSFEVEFQCGDLPKFVNKYPLPNKIIETRVEQLVLF